MCLKIIDMECKSKTSCKKITEISRVKITRLGISNLSKHGGIWYSISILVYYLVCEFFKLISKYSLNEPAKIHSINKIVIRARNYDRRHCT